MKIIKIMIAFALIISLHLQCMKKPIKPTRLPTFEEMIQKAEKSAEEKKQLAKARKEQMATLQGLPAELQGYLISFIALDVKTYADIVKLAQTIIALAETSKALRAAINSPNVIITIFNILPYTANALSLAKLLQKKPGSLPVIQTDVIRKWLNEAESRLTNPQELITDIEYNNIEGVEKGLKNKNIAINQIIKHIGPYFAYKSPLHAALISANIKITEILLNAGANPNINDPDIWGNWQPLLVAAYMRQIHIPLLLNAGANPNIQNSNGYTPLMMYLHRTPFLLTPDAKKGVYEIVKLFIDSGADVTLKNKDGKTARDYANEKGWIEIVKILDETAQRKK